MRGRSPPHPLLRMMGTRVCRGVGAVLAGAEEPHDFIVGVGVSSRTALGVWRRSSPAAYATGWVWGWVSWAGYEDGALVIVLRGVDPDLERLWEAIEPVVGVLPVLEGSDAWIRQGVGPGMRNGPRAWELWGR